MIGYHGWGRGGTECQLTKEANHSDWVLLLISQASRDSRVHRGSQEQLVTWASSLGTTNVLPMSMGQLTP